MKVRHSLRAFADREAIYDYLDKRSPQGARNVQVAIVRAIRSLALYPRLGQRTDRSGVHELIVPRRPYKVANHAVLNPPPGAAAPARASRLCRTP